MRWILGMILLGISVVSSAAIYKSVDQNGNVIYSDKSTPGAEAVTLPPIQSYSVPASSSAQQSSAANEPPTAAPIRNYQITLSTPADQEIFRVRSREIPAGVTVSPALQADEQIVFLLDDKTATVQVTESGYLIQNIDPGVHTLQAVICDKAGNDLAVSDKRRFALYLPTHVSQDNSRISSS